MDQVNDWRKILMHDLPFTFLLEVVIRTVIMFLIILLALRASGKRGIKQLSIFELVLIIGLGSAAGDPMFYEDVGILPALTVFLVVITLYITVTKLSDRFIPVEKILEGTPLYVIKEGHLQMEAFKQSDLSKDEFFAELRAHNIEHLGQVRTVLIETSGEFSILYYPDEEVRPGLPVFPDELKQKVTTYGPHQHLSCKDCGYTFETVDAKMVDCPECAIQEWVVAKNNRRIS